MNSNYETLYGVGFLDDLHNYFPSLLYDSSSFGNVRDVLGYIQLQARNRFDLFSYGQREYLSTHPSPAPAPAPAPRVSPSVSVSASEPVSVSRRVVRTSFASMPPQAPSPISTLLRRQPSLLPFNSIRMDNAMPNDVGASTIRENLNMNIPNIFVDIQPFGNSSQEEDADDEEEASPEQVAQEYSYVTNALLSLLNLPQTALTRNYTTGPRMMEQFLQPVVVRPTEEQISANTTLGNLVSDTEHACAICQDALTSEQEGRKLNACGHWFHRGCIDTWLERDVHCPVCRHDIREPLQQQDQ